MNILMFCIECKEVKLRGQQTKYCSASCRCRYKSRRYRIKKGIKPYHREKICVECKKVKLTGQQRKFCSDRCRNCNGAKRHYQRYGRNSYKDKICLQCSSQYKPTRGKQKYCSKECSLDSRGRRFLNIPDCIEGAHRSLDKNLGYVRVYCPMHPKANTWGYVYEHRLLVEETLGRFLLKGEVVHHKNRKRWDNRLENLEVLSASEHSKLHAKAAS